MWRDQFLVVPVLGIIDPVILAIERLDYRGKIANLANFAKERDVDVRILSFYGAQSLIVVPDFERV